MNERTRRCGLAQDGRAVASAALGLARVAFAGALLASGLARADDRANLEDTRIIGNRELPKVLYIVPWKKPLPGELSGRPAHSILDEALAPLDRDVFRRQVRYDEQLAPAPAGAGAAPSAGQRAK